MNFSQYLDHFQSILDQPQPEPPYDNPDYAAYTRLNWSRMQRWLKQAVIETDLKETVQQITAPMQWIIITEPWCGDAAHTVPILELTARLNPLITVSYQLRDSEPYLINSYLTNGGKSIPKLIIRNNELQDLATWGPRPAACQLVYNELMTAQADFETVKTKLQHWYNEDKGKSAQRELRQLLEGIRLS